jgi:hypothetical protein
MVRIVLKDTLPRASFMGVNPPQPKAGPPQDQATATLVFVVGSIRDHASRLFGRRLAMTDGACGVWSAPQ